MLTTTTDPDGDLKVAHQTGSILFVKPETLIVEGSK